MSDRKSYDDETIRKSGLTEREETQLPEWAQDRIKSMRASLPKTEETRIHAGDLDNPIYLSDDQFSPVRFHLDDTHIDVKLRYDTSGEEKVPLLEVSTPKKVSIQPQSVNTAVITAID